ncbi:hypothetical protein FOB84_09820 [Gordonia bronchialis]|uniref:hypothetical protein n=1 Tax=Gordonia bronchialis TaxID=2054 RepID=UPI0002FD2AA9|nr:hypothetical protein [Gordonia bronchialis]MCC3324802.1 hypothetical protein [Gordonia bronchialis]QGS24412.1 hypothetical protein FOB84_09820 [Gordonia bronchialis]UAK39292.1 hypothetical protein K8O93_06230 [Gordonia bronchialis]
MSVLFAAVLLTVGLAACGSSDDEATGTSASDARVSVPPEPVFTPVVGEVMFAPTPFVGSDGRRHLVYEIALTNFTAAPVTLGGLRVLDASSRTPVLELSSGGLAARTKPVGGPEGGSAPGAPEGYSNILRGGQNGIVFVHIVISAGAQVPTTLVHELDVVAQAAPPGSNRMTETLAQARVGSGDVPVLAPPLSGANYLAADACCDAMRHTHAVLPVNGSPYLAQRYAVDWEQADDQGRIFVGDPKNPASYRIFGDDALAVADGVVVASRNDLPEQTPGEYPQGIALADADGNNLVLDIGNGFFVNPLAGDAAARRAALRGPHPVAGGVLDHRRPTRRSARMREKQFR